MDPRIQRVLRAVEENCDRHFTAAQLAREVGLSRSHFERLFSHETGSTFRKHLREARLKRAEELLLDWRLSLKEIAGRVGYEHASSFTREFRRRFGISPSVYRDRASQR
jgi:transcriptional regulator GlxA family with amidase domain